MTDRTWIGGHDGNNVLSANNWDPAGVPQAGDGLLVASGTLAIANTDLAGNTIILQQSGEGVSVELDLNGHARIGVAGGLGYGNTLSTKATGADRLDASSGALNGTIDLAANSHLVVTGTLQFGYYESLSGPPDSALVNNGTIQTEDGTVSVPVRGTGTLGFSGYHDSSGVSSISAPVSAGQTVSLNPGPFGMQLTLTDPNSFHGTLDIEPPPSSPAKDVAVLLQGIQATSFDLKGDQILIKDGHHTVDDIRMADLGSVSVSASFNPTSTQLDFLPASTT